MYSNMLGLAALLAGTAASAGITTASFNDPNTGIDFQAYTAPDTDYRFGIVIPETPGADFIGQMVIPITTAGGWGAVSLNGGMLNHLLLLAWANGEEILTSFRIATSYANPDVYTATTVAAVPIANGTFVNSTHISYTFLCQGCITGSTASFNSSAPTPIFGYAVAADNPTTVSDPTSALTYHGAGFGQYAVDLANAKSANYDTWASWASATTTTPVTTPIGSGNSTNSTTPTYGNSTSSVPTTLNSTYDVIVVGGGPAGIVAAERLAESGVSVLLIERGPANTVALGSTLELPWNDTLTPYDIPALGSSLTTLSGTKFCSDTASTAGCLLGGSSSINGLNFIHPPEHDFERWPTGWQWSDISEAADRLYSRNPGTTLPSADKKYYDDSAFTTLSSLLAGKKWTQVDSIESPNEKHNVYSRPAWSITGNLRAGPARTYMPFAKALPNFTLKLETKVTQLVRTGGKITGVLTLAADGSSQLINLKDNGKVVLAAGAMSTPRILWNSGIGLKDALTIVKTGTSGVTLPDEADWISLPVGHNLQDHAQVQIQFNSATNFTAYAFNAIATDPVDSDLELFQKGSGPLSQAAQRMHLWTSVNGTDGRTRYLQGTASAMATGVVTVRAFLTHGTTTLGELGISASGNTILNTKPWLVDAADNKAMSDFIQFWLDTTSNSTLSYITPGSTPASIIANKMISGDHWVGSAKMGTDDGRVSNGTSVVDLDTKVYGTDNLFVVDASIHPDLPTGNTQAIIMITAEHAAKKIAAYGVTSNADDDDDC